MAYKTNATEIVYDFICEKIQNGFWKSGEKIWTEYKLTSELDVSRVAVRQAIDKLVTTNVLRRVQGSGTYVRHNSAVFITSSPSHTFTDSDLLDICRFRVFFESGNIELFIQYATPEEFEKLHEIHDKLMSCDKNSPEFFHYDFEFHSAIAKGTKNFFTNQIFALLNMILIKNQERMHQVLGPEIALKYHPQILEYIDSKDITAASLLMRRHMEDTTSSFEKYLLENKEKRNGFL